MFNRYAEARIKKSSTNKVRYFKPTLYPDIEEKDTDVIHNVRAVSYTHLTLPTICSV